MAILDEKGLSTCVLPEITLIKTFSVLYHLTTASESTKLHYFIGTLHANEMASFQKSREMSLKSK